MTVRSYLFVPADRPERFAKALASGADAIIVDLEDAVAPAAKATARSNLAQWLSDSHAPPKPVVVRINAVDTEWFDADLSVCSAPGVYAIMLPKTERTDEVLHVADGSRKNVIALVETAMGLDNLRAIAHAAPVERIAFGSIDFQLDVGIAGDGEELLAFRSQLVLASRVAGLEAPVDGVSTSISDAAAVRADAQRARRLGFGAKLCIHPAQVEAVNQAFSPSAEELAWASRVLAAAQAAGGAAVAVDGKMVDRPVILRAQKILGTTL
jgi:citrate lyase subunit beta/citryl-CoA lyase